MYSKINVLARRKTKLFGVGMGDLLFLAFFGFVPPFIGYMVLQVPFFVTATVVTLPVFVVVLGFRVGRRDGYLIHRVAYWLRPRYWVCGFSMKNRWDSLDFLCSGWISKKSLFLEMLSRRRR